MSPAAVRRARQNDPRAASGHPGRDRKQALKRPHRADQRAAAAPLARPPERLGRAARDRADRRNLRARQALAPGGAGFRPRAAEGNVEGDSFLAWSQPESADHRPRSMLGPAPARPPARMSGLLHARGQLRPSLPGSTDARRHRTVYSQCEGRRREQCSHTPQARSHYAAQLRRASTRRSHATSSMQARSHYAAQLRRAAQLRGARLAPTAWRPLAPSSFAACWAV